ncbi:MAG: hypothetical protein WC551_06025 [Patescibacteria group bacterium]
MELALLLHLKGKPLVRSLDGGSGDEFIADVVNAARLHGHAQLVTRTGCESGGTKDEAEEAKKKILGMAVSEGEFEIAIKTIRASDDLISCLLDIYCKK